MTNANPLRAQIVKPNGLDEKFLALKQKGDLKNIRASKWYSLDLENIGYGC